MGLADKVTAVLQTSILPSVIARGGEIRVLRVDGDTVVLEVAGSPGAALPLVGRIEASIGDGLADRVRDVLEREINPLIAAHRGQASLVAVDEGWVRLRLDGGCQGCSLAEVTLRQGIEPLLRAKVPGVVGLIDVTDHEAGREPFYPTAKR